MSTISVIIPSYNSGRYIRETVESVLAQTHPATEILLVDDGSSDNTLALAAQYPAVRIVRRRHAGVAAARNTGLQESTGEYLVFLDHDDRLLPQALETHLRCLLDQPDCAFSFGDAQCIDAAGVPMSAAACAAWGIPPRSSSPHEGANHYLSLLRGSYIWTPSMVMYRRDVLEALSGFATGVGPVDDTDLHLRITRAYPVYHNRSLVAEKRLHEGNHSRHQALLLQSMIRRLRQERLLLLRNPRAREALESGIRSYQEYYGQPLLVQILANLRRGKEWQQTWSDARVLLRYAPLVPARCAFRRGQLLLRAITPKSLARAALPKESTLGGLARDAWHRLRPPVEMLLEALALSRGLFSHPKLVLRSRVNRNRTGAPRSPAPIRD
jgi:glycosyltransferase involved in cell wall biosynthesis